MQIGKKRLQSRCTEEKRFKVKQWGKKKQREGRGRQGDEGESVKEQERVKGGWKIGRNKKKRHTVVW